MPPVPFAPVGIGNNRSASSWLRCTFGPGSCTIGPGSVDLRQVECHGPVVVAVLDNPISAGMTSPVPTALTPSPRMMPWLPLTEERHVVITKWCVVPWQLPGAIAPVQVAIVDGWCNRHRLVTSVVHDDETPACSGSRISLMCESPFGVYSGADWLRDDIGDSRGLP